MMPILSAAMRHYASSLLDRDRGRQAASPLTLEDDLLDLIRDTRHAVRVAEGGGGQCHEVTAWLSDVASLARLAVSYLTPSGAVISAGHYVNMLADGSILDPTADQFGDGPDIRLLTPEDPEYGRYRPEFDGDFNPSIAGIGLDEWRAFWTGEEDIDQQVRLRQEHGAGWWLPDKTAYLAYWKMQSGIADDFYRPYCAEVIRALEPDHGESHRPPSSHTVCMTSP